MKKLLVLLVFALLSFSVKAQSVNDNKSTITEWHKHGKNVDGVEFYRINHENISIIYFINDDDIICEIKYLVYTEDALKELLNIAKDAGYVYSETKSNDDCVVFINVEYKLTITIMLSQDETIFYIFIEQTKFVL